MDEHFDYFNNFIYMLNYFPNDYKTKRRKDIMTFNLCLQAEDGLVLISDSRRVDMSTSGLIDDTQIKLYQLSNDCGLMVSGNLFPFRGFLHKLLDERLSKSDNISSTLAKINKTIHCEKETYKEFFDKAEKPNEDFSNLKQSFRLLLCGYHFKDKSKAIPNILLMEISQTIYPFVFSYGNYARKKHVEQIIHEGFVLGGIREIEIENKIKNRYNEIFLPKLVEAKDWAFESYKETTKMYCTTGGKPQMAIITPKNGFEFISNKEIEENKSKWANVI